VVYFKPGTRHPVTFFYEKYGKQAQNSNPHQYNRFRPGDGLNAIILPSIFFLFADHKNIGSFSQASFLLRAHKFFNIKGAFFLGHIYFKDPEILILLRRSS